MDTPTLSNLLGQRVNSRGLSTSEEKLKAIAGLKFPSSRTDYLGSWMEEVLSKEVRGWFGLGGRMVGFSWGEGSVEGDVGFVDVGFIFLGL